MDVQKVLGLLKKEEGPKLDFKEAMDLSLESAKKELAKDCIAIANAQGGRGYLLIGVKDKSKEIIGVKKHLVNEERIQQTISLRVDPPITVRADYYDVEDKTLLLVTVFRSYKRPHQNRQTGAFYIRRGSTTDIMRRDEIAAMLQVGGYLSNESIPLYNLSCHVLNYDRIKDYADRLNLIWDGSENRVLSDLGIAYYDMDSDEYRPTLGGLLVFSDNPQSYLTNVGIQILDSGKRTFITGDILSLLRKTEQYLMDRLNNYPMDALMEAVTNAVIHRDYFDRSRDILIYISPTKVVVSNPGSIHGREKLNHMKSNRNSRRRNGWLYQKLVTLDEDHHFINGYRGLKTIREESKKIKSVKILNLRRQNLFKVILPGTKDVE